LRYKTRSEKGTYEPVKRFWYLRRGEKDHWVTGTTGTSSIPAQMKIQNDETLRRLAKTHELVGLKNPSRKEVD